jgi:hypothetical protein
VSLVCGQFPKLRTALRTSKRDVSQQDKLPVGSSWFH